MAETEDRAAQVKTWYDPARWRFRAFEQAVVPHLRRALVAGGLGNFQLESRTKTVESFVAKALAPDPVDPEGFKYSNPQSEISDAVGARIIVPLSTDVEPVLDLLHQRFNVLEEEARGAAEQLEVPGYQSWHLLLRLGETDRRMPEFRDMADMVAEVQVRTILQHAWASLQYDISYKADGPPAPALTRRLTALAGVLELADREFVRVREEHGQARPMVTAGRVARDSQALTPAAVRSLVGSLLGGTDDTEQIWFDAMPSVLAELGLDNVGAMKRSLHGWEARVPEVAQAVRSQRPYANQVYVFDQLLRLALGVEYFDRRLEHAELDRPEQARREFMIDRDALLRTLEAGS